MSSERLTTADYWDAGYVTAGSREPLETSDFRRFGERRLVESLEALGLAGRHVLEVGAGNSAVLTLLARRYAGRARFTGLDYAPTGCRMLAERAGREGAEVEVLQQDLFDPAPALEHRFDLVYSIGVVEHFTDVTRVLEAKRRLVRPGGLIYTLIPNMRGAIGALTRHYNRRIYDLHVAHDLASLRQGHEAAGLEVLRASHLCSTNFGVLSSCFQSPADRGFATYKWLSRVTKALWWVEARVGELPAIPALSPYLIVVSRAPDAGR
jgi:2-polyprenyl-3-methyl-5-hydroxy-6-metoxy-1,4-benzoquinol methylase